MLIVYNKEGNNTTMLPEEQLFNTLRNKQAGIIFGDDGSSGLFFQQGNLGGKAFKSEEDPLTSLLGQEFNEKYRQDYADTLNNTWFSGDNRLTSQTGARLLKDLDKMDARGIAALRGLASNPDKAISWIKDINNSRVGVGGYTRNQAIKDTKDITNKIRLAARLRRTGDNGLFNTIAKHYVRGQFGDAISGMRKATENIPWYVKPFVRDYSKELENENFVRRENGVNKLTAKVQSTSSTGNIDEGGFTGKTDEQRSSEAGSFFDKLKGSLGNMYTEAKDKLGPATEYMLPSLLLGALGGGINKANGGSFLAPLLLMLLMGGMYGIGRKNNWLGSDDNVVNSTIDKITGKTKNYADKLYQGAKQVTEPYVDKATEFITSKSNPPENVPAVVGKKSACFNKFANYNKAAIIDLLH